MKSSKFTFIAIFILLTPIISITSNAEENTLANYASIEFVGDATQVQIIGEWDWRIITAPHNSLCSKRF